LEDHLFEHTLHKVLLGFHLPRTLIAGYDIMKLKVLWCTHHWLV